MEDWLYLSVLELLKFITKFFTALSTLMCKMMVLDFVYNMYALFKCYILICMLTN